MRRIGIAAALVIGLTGCVTEGPTPPGAYVEVFSGGAFSGSRSTRIYADDRIETSVVGPFGKTPGQTQRAGLPGAYDAALGIVLTEGPGVAARQRDVPICMDYGVDAVRVVPSVGGFEGVSADCPDPQVQGLQSRVLAAIGAE